MTVFLPLLVLVQPSTTVTGVVKDSTGAPMQGVVVTATAGTSRATATTAADGTWSVALPAGAATATIKITAQGFASERREVTLPATPIAVELRPEAIAEIGSELEFEWRAGRLLTATTAWAFNNSQFTSGELDGRRVPQVPRASGLIGVRAGGSAWSAAAAIRVFGEQFDDDINQFTLRSGSVTDARAAWRLSRRAEVFGAIENAFDNEIDTGKTPLRTIGAPRQSRAGIIVRF